MNKEKRRVPKLRFPGFTEDWEQRKLGDFTNQINTFVNPEDAKLPLWSLTAESGLIEKSDRYERDFLVKKKDQFKRIETNTLVYNPMNITIGSIDIYTGLYPIAVSGYYVSIVYDKNIDTDFLKEALLLPSSLKMYKNYATGSLIERQRVQYPTFSKLQLLFPNLDEQKAIGQLFKSLNLNITLHQRKLEHLNLKKKALLQKLFPKNGERYPELRFPGFTDDWEQRKLSDISMKVTTKNVDVHYTETLTNSAEQGIISQVDFFDKEISNKDNINGYYIVENNDFIYNPRISTLAPVGPINRNKLNRTGIMSPLYTVFRASKVDLGFLEWYFQSNHWHRYMKLNGDSGARADRIAIKDSTFFEMPIKTPVNIKEQVFIGETLEMFNQYITLHQRKLEHLQLQKKALLQQMFV